MASGKDNIYRIITKSQGQSYSARNRGKQFDSPHTSHRHSSPQRYKIYTSDSSTSSCGSECSSSHRDRQRKRHSHRHKQKYKSKSPPAYYHHKERSPPTRKRGQYFIEIGSPPMK